MRKLLTLICIALLPVISGCMAVAVGGAAATGFIIGEDRRTVGTITEDQGIEPCSLERSDSPLRVSRRDNAAIADDHRPLHA